MCRHLVIVWYLLGLLPSLAYPAESAKQRPNIVVFLVDDMGIMDTSVPFVAGPNGKPIRQPLNAFYRTPSMERLARQGIRFTDFSAMSVCSPTRISLLTGQNAARHRTTNWINPDRDNAGPLGPTDWNWRGLNKNSLTLPRLLQASGYRTIHIGKGHFGPRDSEGAEPRNLGFDVNIAGCSIGAPGSYFARDQFGATTKRKSHAVPHLEKYHGTELFLTEALTREAKVELEKSVASGQPFFLYFAHYAVHAPFQADPRFAKHYAESGKPATAQAFATLIEGMDRSLGDLLDHLERLNVAENTLIFFLGDNGSDAPLGDPHAVASSAPYRGKKGSHYEGGTRVPFIAAWAKANPNRPVQQSLPIPTNALQTQPGSVMDLFPTILDVTGTPAPSGHLVDGHSLSTLLRGQPDPNHPRTFLMHYPHAPHRSDYFTVYREGDWKVVYHYQPSPASENSHYQLFHLKVDPYESMNLAVKEPRELSRMMRGLIASLDHHHALFPRDPKTGQPTRPILP